MNPGDGFKYDLNDPVHGYYDTLVYYNIDKYAQRFGDKVRIYFTGKYYREFDFNQVQELMHILNKLQFDYMIELNGRILEQKSKIKEQDDIIEDLERQVEDLQ